MEDEQFCAIVMSNQFALSYSEIKKLGKIMKVSETYQVKVKNLKYFNREDWEKVIFDHDYYNQLI